MPYPVGIDIHMGRMTLEISPTTCFSSCGIKQIACLVRQRLWGFLNVHYGGWLDVTAPCTTHTRARDGDTRCALHAPQARALSLTALRTWGVVKNPLIPWMIGYLIGHWINNRLEDMVSIPFAAFTAVSLGLSIGVGGEQYVAGWVTIAYILHDR